jgi:hypothetical protein
MSPLPTVHAVRPCVIALVAGMGMVVGGGSVVGQSIEARATRPVVPLLVGEERLNVRSDRQRFRGVAVSADLVGTP